MQHFWEHAWRDAQPRLSAIHASVPSLTSPTARIAQIDAEQLDAELVQLLKHPFANALGLLSSSFSLVLEPELVLIIQSILYKFSVWDFGATQGARLQGLRFYRPPSVPGMALTPSNLPRRAMLIHASMTIIMPYLHSRARLFALSRAWPDAPSLYYRRKAWDALTAAESIHSTLSLVSFVAFLWNGRYRTIADRILSLRLVPAQHAVSRSVSYEFMNRQMVWHAFTEFILFLLPLVNTRRLRRGLNAKFSRLRLSHVVPSAVRCLNGVAPAVAVNDNVPRGKFHDLPLDDCAICAENFAFTTLSDLHKHPQPRSALDRHMPQYPIQTAYLASCGHAYCYFCLAQAMIRSEDEGEPAWECLRCGEQVLTANRVCVDDDTTSINSLDVDGISLDSYDSLRRTSSEG